MPAPRDTKPSWAHPTHAVRDRVTHSNRRPSRSVADAAQIAAIVEDPAVEREVWSAVAFDVDFGMPRPDHRPAMSTLLKRYSPLVPKVVMFEFPASNPASARPRVAIRRSGFAQRTFGRSEPTVPMGLARTVPCL